MKYRRSFHTLTVLPDGKVLATGGADHHRRRRRDRPASSAPRSGIRTPTPGRPTASHRRPRLYHSSALLLPDGRVLLAGGGAFGNAPEREERRDLLAAVPVQGPAPDDHRRAPTQLGYGQSFTVDTPDAARASSGVAGPHGLGHAQPRHGPALHERSA